MESVVAVTPEKCIMIDAAAEEWEELDMAVDNVEGEACRKDIKYEVASSTPISSRSLGSQAKGAFGSSCADLLGRATPSKEEGGGVKKARSAYWLWLDEATVHGRGAGG